MNQVTLIGNVGKDPMMFKTKSGKSVAKFSLAVKEDEGTKWHNVIAWEKTAEYCEESIRKGSRVKITGYEKQREYMSREGEQKSITEFIADRVESLERKED